MKQRNHPVIGSAYEPEWYVNRSYEKYEWKRGPMGQHEHLVQQALLQHEADLRDGPMRSALEFCTKSAACTVALWFVMYVLAVGAYLLLAV